jgi:copper resistance protein B
MSNLKKTDGEARVRARPEHKPLALTVLAMAMSMAQASHAEVPTDHDMSTHSSTAPAPAKAKEEASVKVAGKDHAATVDQTMDHGQMQGMDHSKMEGMDHSQMQGMDHSKMEGMDHSQMQGKDHGKMEGMDHRQMQGMDHGQMEGMDHSQKQGVDHGKMEGMGHGRMQGGSAPPDARDPDYSDGISPGPMHGMHHMHGESVISSLVINRLEQFHGDDANGQAIDAQAWLGSDLNKVWFKLDGERSDGHLGATRTELLWNRAISPYWGMQVGARHDFGEGPGRNWAAFGFQGLSPYWFEVEATAYLGESGRTALRVEADYELLLTQRLILQPDVELNFYGKDDPARDIGAGFSDLDVGLRLRYEITRKFAPYAGVVWSRKFGKTAEIARASGGEVSDTQLVAGLRLWF